MVKMKLYHKISQIIPHQDWIQQHSATNATEGMLGKLEKHRRHVRNGWTTLRVSWTPMMTDIKIIGIF